MVAQVKVKYACVGGMHFFTSGDTLTKGLCAGHEDLKTAFDEVAVQLKYLFEKNHKQVAEFATIPFEEFQAWLDKVKTPQPKIRPIPAAELDWRNVKAAA